LAVSINLKCINFNSYVEIPVHPSLRIKKIQGQKDIFEASITINIRMTWQYLKENIVLLRKVGPHDKPIEYGTT